MKYIFTLILMSILCISAVEGQNSLQIVDYDINNYPSVKARIFAYDNEGNTRKNLQAADFSVTDNGIPFNLQYINCTANAQPKNHSVVLSFDRAVSSGDTSLKFFKLSKKIMDSIARAIDYSSSEVSVTSFDLWSYLNLDFSHSQINVVNSIIGIQPTNSSSLKSSLTFEPTGALEIAKSGANKKSIVIVTYGVIDFNTDEMINLSKAENISIFILYLGKKIPAELKRLAIETGGFYFDSINENTKIQPLVLSLLNMMNGNEPCELMWYGDYECLENHQIVLTDKINSTNANFNFTIIDNEKPTLTSNPEYLEYSSVPLGQDLTQDIVITAVNSDIVITRTSIADPQFQITQGNITSPKIIYKNSTHTLSIKYTPIDSAIVFTKLILESNACFGKEIYITGGFPNRPPKTKTIEIINPKCGETLVIGDSIDVRWQGLLPKDVIQIEYTIDNGKNWHTLAKNTENLKHNWLIPHIETDNLLIRAIQLWPNNVGRTLDLKHLSAVNSAFFNKKGDRVVTASDDSCAVIWNSNNGEILHKIKHQEKVNYAIFDKSGKTVYVATKNRLVYSYDAETGQSIRQYQHDGTSEVLSVEINPTDDKIVSVSGSKLYIWDVGGALIKKIDYAPDDVPLYAVFDNIGSKIMLTSQSGIARFYSPTGDLIRQFDTKKPGEKFANSRHGSFNLDGSKIAVVNDPLYSAYIFDYNSGIRLYEVNHHIGDSTKIFINHTSFFYNPDDNTEYLLTAGTDNSAKRWLAANGSIPKGLDGKDTLHLFREHTKPVQTSVFNFDGSRLLTSSWDSTAKIWNLNQRDLQMDSTNCFISIGRAKIEAIPIDFGDVLLGDVAIKTQGFLRNLKDFKFNIRNIRFYGDDLSDFQIIEDIKTPSILDANELRTLSIRFEPSQPGIRRAFAEIIIPNDTIIVEIKGIGIDIGLRTNANVIDFGEVEVDEYRDTTLVGFVTNISNKAITIDSVYFDGSNQNFRLLNLPKLPIILNPNERLDLTFRFMPYFLGKLNSLISFKHSGSGSPMRISLFGQGIGIVKDTINIELADISGKPGETVTLPMKITKISQNGAFGGISNIRASLSFNSTMLEPIGDFVSDNIDRYLRTIEFDIPFDNSNAVFNHSIKFKIGNGNDTISKLHLFDTRPLENAKLKIYFNEAKFSLINSCNEGGPRLFDPVTGRMLLFQNKPNPFSTTTTIDFELIERGNTKLSIFDLTGELIRVVFYEWREAGVYSIQVSANDYAPGIYYYILETPTQKFIRTMQIIK